MTLLHVDRRQLTSALFVFSPSCRRFRPHAAVPHRERPGGLAAGMATGQGDAYAADRREEAGSRALQRFRYGCSGLHHEAPSLRRCEDMAGRLALQGCAAPSGAEAAAAFCELARPDRVFLEAGPEADSGALGSRQGGEDRAERRGSTVAAPRRLPWRLSTDSPPSRTPRTRVPRLDAIEAEAREDRGQRPDALAASGRRTRHRRQGASRGR